MRRSLDIRDIGLQPYEPVVALQEELGAARKRGEAADTLILVEHEPVYTLGRSAKESNIVFSQDELDRIGIGVVRTTRGGDITYHGPGQLVGYPIIKLDTRGGGVVRYVNLLESMLIETLACFGITGSRDSCNRGVWVGREKIAAIGVRVTRGVTLHGFSMNVRSNLDHYGGIIPCGLADRGVTSMHLFEPKIRMEDVKPVLVERFLEGFGYEECEVRNG